MTTSLTFPLTDQRIALVQRVLQEAIAYGVVDFCVCPGGRNSLFVSELKQLQLQHEIKTYYWHEERSAAFFALGLSRSTSRPVAVITTSGTAVGELLPAVMEAFYTGVPLLLITADRPRRFRHSGAPQTAMQPGIFGEYVRWCEDLEYCSRETCCNWNREGPGHVNVCIEESFVSSEPEDTEISLDKIRTIIGGTSSYQLDYFFKRVKNLFVVVSALRPAVREAVVKFLIALNAPLYLEGISGLREDPRLRHLRITRTENVRAAAAANGYAIDGVLRIGGVPTFRFWRDLEDLIGEVNVCSISEAPFSGLSWATVIHEPIDTFLTEFTLTRKDDTAGYAAWISDDRRYAAGLEALCYKYPRAEPAIFHHLSRCIPKKSMIYLGNSLPIREWDLAACSEIRDYQVFASRGLNGIDGQISTFLGFCRPQASNWGILGDLTTLYDMSGPWILPQLQDVTATLVVVNNGGGKIFDRMFPDKEIQNLHDRVFKPLADMWGLTYERWNEVPEAPQATTVNRLIEIVPDVATTALFWEELG